MSEQDLSCTVYLPSLVMICPVVFLTFLSLFFPTFKVLRPPYQTATLTTGLMSSPGPTVLGGPCFVGMQSRAFRSLKGKGSGGNNFSPHFHAPSTHHSLCLGMHYIQVCKFLHRDSITKLDGVMLCIINALHLQSPVWPVWKLQFLYRLPLYLYFFL